MKKRWMKSVVETSKQQAPIMPYHRSARHAAKVQLLQRALKSA